MKIFIIIIIVMLFIGCYSDMEGDQSDIRGLNLSGLEQCEEGNFICSDNIRYMCVETGWREVQDCSTFNRTCKEVEISHGTTAYCR